MSSDSATRITVLGPSHPHPGGISQHTTRLALELQARGADVIVESWKRQYPQSLYPESTLVPDDAPEVGRPQQLRNSLTWYNPLSWWLAGRRARRQNTIVVNIPTPLHALVYAVIFAAAGKGTRRVGIVHNPRAHEPGRFDDLLIRDLISRLDHVIVHGESQQRTLSEISRGDGFIQSLPLPSPWHEVRQQDEASSTEDGCRVLFFGTIRPYKGLSVLFRALAQVPEASLLVAGRFWEDRAPYEEEIAALDLSDRVEIRDHYVDHRDFAELFGRADVVVLPYLEATASIVPDLALAHHVPVIATAVGELARSVNSGRNGLVIQPGDVDELVKALRIACNPKKRNLWSEGISASHGENQDRWSAYCDAIL